MTPGSAVRLASVARHVTDCATRPGDLIITVLLSQPNMHCFTDDYMVVECIKIVSTAAT